MLYLKSVSGRFRGGDTELKMAATQSWGGVGQSGDNRGAPIVFGIVNGVLIRKEQVIVTTYPDLHFYVKNTAAQLEVIYKLGMRWAMQENPLPQGVIKSVDVAVPDSTSQWSDHSTATGAIIKASNLDCPQIIYHVPSWSQNFELQS